MVTNPITPIPPYAPDMLPIPQVTPFTYRDGQTYLNKLEGIVQYINRVVLPTINEQVNDLGNEFVTQVNYYIEQVNTAIQAEHDWVVGQIGDLGGKSVEQAIADLTQFVNDTMAEVLADGVQLQDPVMAGIVNTPTSQTTVALRGIYSQKVKPNAKWDFGAVGNGTADDTAALQAFFNYCTTNGVVGILPPGNYKITSPINISLKPYWGVESAGYGATTITQATDNTKILVIGSDTASTMHSWKLHGITFQWANNQPVTNTNAIALSFEQEVHGGRIEDLIFVNGYYAIKVKSGIGCPWGCDWINLRFGDAITGGAIDFSAGVNGVPNNHFGRFLFSCGSAVGPIVRMRGYNCVIDTWEFINCLQGPQLFELNSGGQATIHQLKLEGGNYAANQTLVNVVGNGKLDVGMFSLTGNAMNITGGVINCFGVGSGLAGGYLNIDSLRLVPLAPTNGALLVGVNAVNAAQVEIGIYEVQNGAQLLNQGSNTTGETLTVRTQIQPRLSPAAPDADYVTTLNGYNRINFTTPFTAARNIDLPTDNNSLFNGLTYEFIFNGAINGTNIANIRCNGTVFRNHSTDKTVLRYMYTRSPSNPQSGWKLVGYNTLP
jgi:hypothetical protein